MGTLPAWTPGIRCQNRADKTVGEYLDAPKSVRWLSGMDADCESPSASDQVVCQTLNPGNGSPFYPGRLMRSFRAFFLFDGPTGSQDQHILSQK